MRLFWAFLFSGVLGCAQRGTGELRLSVEDPAGQSVTARGTLVSLAHQQQRDIVTDAEGRDTLQALPFGRYTLKLESPGFAAFSAAIEIRSEVPLNYRAALTLIPVSTAVLVTDDETLLDSTRTGSANYLSAEALRDRKSSTPGKAIIDLVNSQPGWLLEANGILHPRGSEYQVQYVIDGLPLFENRSPAFAQLLSAGQFQTMRILTGGYPAEYGHKLGGVIEVTTKRDTDPGFHGEAELQGGSFDTVNGFLSGQYHSKNTTAGASVQLYQTDRYLDPPVEQNYTNHGSGGAASFDVAEDWSERDRTRVSVSGQRNGFLVPNERLQEQAGQRQDRNADEYSGQVVHEHVFSPDLLGSVQGRVRDTSAGLWSNPLSTPILPSQDRGFREWYGSASVAGHKGRHAWKAGIEALHASIHEQFGYTIAAYQVGGLQIFDPAVPRVFAFHDRGSDDEQSGYLQDTVQLGRLTLSGGLRFDRYRLRSAENAVSPRLGAAWSFPSIRLAIRASYDRVFQTPGIENVLLASANLVDRLGGTGAFLPLRPSRGNFFESGLSKTLFEHLRIDGTWFHRSVHNFEDDSLLLNTGVSFPIAFRRGTIHGFEAKVEVPPWGHFSGFVSWSNMLGRGDLPVAGGLLLGADAEAVNQQGSFPISQDQRNSLRGRARCALGTRAWAAVGSTYNSGLPVEIEQDADTAVFVQQYGQRIVDRVNFERGRLRPSFSLDLSGGLDLWKHERRTVRLQGDLLNLTGRLNVINFAGLFSGTAVEPRRNAAIRLTTEF